MSVNQIDVNAVNERTRKAKEYAKEFNVTPAQVKRELELIRAEKSRREESIVECRS